MTVTLNLPPDVERAFLAEAQTRGLTLDEFISAMLVSQSPAKQAPSTKAIGSSTAASRFFPLEQEDGVPVLRTGQPLNPSVIDDTLDMIRRERELSMLGTF